jgi:hypothetical protein
MRWLLALAEAFAQARYRRFDRLADRWLSRAEWLRRRQEALSQPDLFDGDQQ